MADQPNLLPNDLPEALERAAQSFASRGVAVFDSRVREYERRTYPELLASVNEAAGRWAALGMQPGDRVVVSLPTSWPFLEGWLGAMMLGVLPVAVAPAAGFGGWRAQLHKLANVKELVGAKAILAGTNVVDEARNAGQDELATSVVTPEAFAGAIPKKTEPLRPSPEDVAFLQLTSGSTSFPRAVQIRHSGAIHNANAVDDVVGFPHGDLASRTADSMVSWLPLHHDMGLVGCLLLCLVGGLDLWLLPPTSFLARPWRWLEQFSQRGVAFAHAPNFAYQLCIERITDEQRAGLDLSLWRDAMSGAEMIRPETIAGFEEAFAPVGFRPEAFRPSYGLAEATLVVSMDRKGQGARTQPLPAGSSADGFGLSEVVCLGGAVKDTELRVAGPNGAALDDGVVGEVLVRGPGLFAGYMNDEAATAETLRDGWLRTGDLGFLVDNELYLTGRTKDILIVRGTNYMPHEIEWLAESVTGGGGAVRSGAFSVATGSAGEEVVLVAETADRDPGKLEALAKDIRDRIGRELSLPVADLVFVRRGRIPKTSSGKVRRRDLKRLYLDGELDVRSG